ncbi:DUF397 domain-containing protein [Streptomyces brevispora]|uniref:DUF397 domain-containing protein n=1 Tax=Streptomyces brevispora TaxID=887462 RepID=UPI0033E98746
MTTESIHWFKSSYSNNGGTCVEWAPTRASVTGVVPVRDSKDLSGPTLSFPVASFASFVAGVKAGDFGTV